MSLAVLAAAGAWAWLAHGLPLGGPEGPGPGFVPLLLAGLLALLGLLLAVARDASGVSGGEGPGGRGEAEGADGDAPPGWGQAALVLGLLALYVAALAHVGYVAATVAVVFLATWRCAPHRPLLALATALGLTGAVWVVLGLLLGVPLPRGPWT